MTLKKSFLTIMLLSTQFIHRKVKLNQLYRITGDGFFTGGKDNKIFKVDLMGNPVQLFEGHESTVNSLS